MSDEKCVIFDLDGTLSLPEHRLHHIKKDKPDWDAFFLACGDDAPNEAIVELNRIVAKSYPVIILSGRSDIAQVETMDWLLKHGIQYSMMLMRQQGDYTPDEDLKKGMYEYLKLDGRVVFAVDDRQKIVDMWRSLGVTCLQVAPGKF